MPTLTDFPLPPIERAAFAGGFAPNGQALLTLDELESYSRGKGRGRERVYKCPFCGASECAFHLNTQTGAFNCKRASCGVKGLLREFWSVSVLPSASLRARAAQQIKSKLELAPCALDAKPNINPGDANCDWRRIFEGALVLDESEAAAARNYLFTRGIEVETATRAGARFCRNWYGGAAILWPTVNGSGELVGVGGRYISADADPKARGAGDMAFGVFLAPAPDNQNPLDTHFPVLVEGPFDALTLAQNGVPSVAMQGVNIPVWLPLRLALKAPRLAPDHDKGGEDALVVWDTAIAPFARNRSTLRPRVKDFNKQLQADGAEAFAAWLKKQLQNNGTAPLSRNTALVYASIVDWERIRSFDAPGAVSICSTVQNFALLLAAACDDLLPYGPVEILIGGEWRCIEEPNLYIRDWNLYWAKRAQLCQAERRELTPVEAVDLDAYVQLLDWLFAAWQPKSWCNPCDLVDAFTLKENAYYDSREPE